jgi:hypothetical protein
MGSWRIGKGNISGTSLKHDLYELVEEMNRRYTVLKDNKVSKRHFTASHEEEKEVTEKESRERNRVDSWPGLAVAH